MHVGVVGLWHLGCVTAASLASGGHSVTAFDVDEGVVGNLHNGKAPIAEPGLDELIRSGVAGGNLRFTTNRAEVVAGAQVVWVTYDTPVDEDDRADIGFIRQEIGELFPHLQDETLVVISSQVPVGTTAAVENDFARQYSGRRVGFAYSPENLRLGNAIAVFTHPDRVIAGVRRHEDRQKLSELLAPFTPNIEWMSVESAEMSKHALNAFLATSVTFINEIAAICEQVGADAKEVERGLKSESRIGPRAYLGPGGAFAGGTLARDIMFLTATARRYGLQPHLIGAVKESNDAHRQWPQRRLTELLGDLRSRQVAVWGLTYKPGTDTLRRSSAVELCHWLIEKEAKVVAFDPAVKSLPDDLRGRMQLAADAPAAIRNADALVVATEWPVLRSIAAEAIVEAMASPLVLDANRFLAHTLGNDPRIRYATVGRAV